MAETLWSAGDGYEPHIGRSRLGTGPDGSIALTARAWAARGTLPR